MQSINFLLAIHNHQPVGNFDFVIEDAYQKAYRPFLDVLARHPSIRIGLHNSGCLLDWLEAHRPEYLDRVQELVDRGQIELMTGGYYEPILPSIPEEDREGQIRKLSAYLERRFGSRPTGLWLTERVWEPSLVGSIARAGAEYTMVDDTHFVAAGLPEDQLWGPFMTEDQGLPLHVFPISKELRYLIPFRPPEETVSFLRDRASEAPGRTALLGDDGEKFGVWPSTHTLVYEKGWLDRFFTLLEENAEWIRLRFPGEVVSGSEPRGKVYLPTASYDEMMEWSLPVDVQTRFHDFRDRVSRSENGDARFVRGGLWRNFFARYPESDHINKRMLALRRSAQKLYGPEPGDPAGAEVVDHLWAAQCNCAYWHGVFGGLYLPHLRNALYERILAAEHLLDSARHPEKEWTEAERTDFDCDGDVEVFLRNPDLTVVAAPAQGGGLEEISVKPLRVALGNGLSRRREAYHRKVSTSGASGASAGDDSASIHDRVESKEEGLVRYLQYDAYRRLSLLDHVLGDDATWESVHAGTHRELGDFLTSAYESAIAGSGTERVVSLRRTGTVWQDGRARRLAIEKRISMPPQGARLRVDYTLEPVDGEPLEILWGVEWNFAMLAPDSPDHRYRIPGVPDAESAFNSSGESSGIEAALVDRHRGFEARLRWTRPARLWRFPVETVSLSEGGFERIYQSSTLLPVWKIRIPEGERHETGFVLEVDEI